MKLLQQTQRLFLRIAFPVFILAGIVMYFGLQWAFDEEIDEKLTEASIEIKNFVQVHDTLPAFFQTSSDRLEISTTPLYRTFPGVFKDTVLNNVLDTETEPFRCLCFPIPIRGQVWQATLFKSTLEREDLVLTVFVLLTGLFALLLGIMAWVNQVVSLKVWRPFLTTLESIRVFRLIDADTLHFDATTVDEFNELNNALEVLAEQAKQDFSSVRQFTENASHELQTPLAIIQNKVEILLQNEALSEEQTRQLVIIAQNISRMARLNQSLLLLSKIENNQFNDRKIVLLKDIIIKKLHWIEDFMVHKKLRIETHLNDFSFEIDPLLAETLVTNLLTNAVKHNLLNGFIKIELSDNQLLVTNTAEIPTLPPTALTARFTRGNTQSEGAGLGLSLIQEICQKCGFSLTVCFDKGIWTAKVVFSNA